MYAADLCGEESFDICRMPRGYTWAELDRLREFTCADPAPDSGRAHWQDTGFGRRAGQRRNTDEFSGQNVLLVNASCDAVEELNRNEV
jgi:hypothetical protein